jgi:hypothetical protein
MILKDGCTERSFLATEVWSAEVETCNLILFHPLLGYQFSMGHVTSPDKGLPSTRGRALERDWTNASHECLYIYETVQSALENDDR